MRLLGRGQAADFASFGHPGDYKAQQYSRNRCQSQCWLWEVIGRCAAEIFNAWRLYWKRQPKLLTKPSESSQTCRGNCRPSDTLCLKVSPQEEIRWLVELLSATLSGPLLRTPFSQLLQAERMVRSLSAVRRAGALSSNAILCSCCSGGASAQYRP